MEVPSELKVDTVQNVNGSLVGKTEMDRINGETENSAGKRISLNTPGGEMNGEPEESLPTSNGESSAPLAITNGEDIYG